MNFKLHYALHFVIFCLYNDSEANKFSTVGLYAKFEDSDLIHI